jgi:hypothetical protein
MQCKHGALVLLNYGSCTIALEEIVPSPTSGGWSIKHKTDDKGNHYYFEFRLFKVHGCADDLYMKNLPSRVLLSHLNSPFCSENPIT